MKNRLLLINSLAVCLLTMGCGTENQNPATSPVTGKITYKGEVVEGATIKILPVDPEGKLANAISGADGTFTLATFEAGDGAMPGKYKVTVRKIVSVEEGVQKDGENAGEPAFVNKDMLPKQYQSIGKTPLDFEVTADGENTLTIDLTD